MPLVSGSKARSNKGFSENIKREIAAGKPQKRAVAIAYSQARKGKKAKDDTAEAWISRKIEELINEGYKPKQAQAIAYAEHRKNKKAHDMGDDGQYWPEGEEDNEEDFHALRQAEKSASSRQKDENGWVEIKGNPISKVGVFEYSGAQIDPSLEPNKIYKVYRPEEELNNPETMESFRLLPWTDEHAMLGSEDDGLLPAEKKGVHGTIGEDVYFEDGYLKANLKIFSQKLADLIEQGKKELSIGYKCLYEMNPGVYNGESYDVIQRQIRGNHIALVKEGRSGPDVRVLDHFKFTLDAKGLKMRRAKDGTEPKDFVKRAEIEDAEEMSMAEMAAELRKLRKELDVLARAEKEEVEMEADNYDESEEERHEVAEKEPRNKEDEFDEDLDIEEHGEKRKDEHALREAEMDEELEKPGPMTDEAQYREGKMTDRHMKDRHHSKDRHHGKDAEKREERKGMDVKLVLKEISRRDALASSLSRHIGVFDHKEKTLSEVVHYGMKKLNLQAPRGYEEAVLYGYLRGCKASNKSFVMDTRKVASSCIDAYLKGDK